MIFVDTNVLIDVLEAPPAPAGKWANRRFRDLVADDRVMTNLVVVAELAAGLVAPDEVDVLLESWSIELIELSIDAAVRAGAAFREYRRRGGPRTTILPDFLIAAHAESIGACLMTRDRRLASYFPDLSLLTPETDHD